MLYDTEFEQQADPIDQSVQMQERLLALNIAAARSHQRTLIPMRQCYYCGEKVASQKLFCDSGCASDWEREQNLKKLAGRG